jgi:hypothetical protein
MEEVMDIMQAEIIRQEGTIRSLEEWEARVRLRRYSWMKKWPQAVHDAYQKYSDIEVELEDQREYFKTLKKNYFTNGDGTPEESLHLAKMAIDCGTLALR